jgi:hypothetical protein
MIHLARPKVISTSLALCPKDISTWPTAPGLLQTREECAKECLNDGVEVNRAQSGWCALHVAARALRTNKSVAVCTGEEEQ